MPTNRKKARKPRQSAMADSQLSAIIQAFEAQCPFGPTFFLTQLRGFVRERCPEETEAWPTVELRLRFSESVEICHVIGVAPRYVALAVYEDSQSGDHPSMRTELLPYEQIERVTVRAMKQMRPGFGFNVARTPALMTQASLMTPEQALHAAATGAIPANASQISGSGHE